MKRFRVFDYIKKYQIPIIILSLLAGILFYGYMQNQQTYSASAVISYTNSGASMGMAPDGSAIDVSEIYSSQVMTQVFERMGMDYQEHNLDNLRSRVVVDAIVTEEEAAVQEAKNSVGEEVTSKPTKYYVTFTATKNDSENPEAFARQVLDNILDVYIQNYGENHINSLAAANSISDLNERDYDYLEMAEILEASINDTLTSIYQKFQQDNTFRSAINGYSFTDLYQEFDLLRKNELSNIYAYVLNNKVTKDKAALLAKYENRIKNFYLNNDASETEITAINNVIDSYVQMMRESGNTNITYEYIIQDVHDTNYEDGGGYTQRVDQTVEYDVLLNDYASNRKSFEWALIDVAYCKYILEIYHGEASIGTMIELETFGNNQESEGEISEETEDANQEAVTAKKNAVTINADAASAEEAFTTTSAMIQNLIKKADNLYKILKVTSDEYNEYGGAANIRLLTDIVVFTNQRILLYACMVVAIFLCALCVAAVVLGRLGDIVDYYVYRDRRFELPNRVGCDRFMETYSNQMLPENFCCVVLRLVKIQEKNARYGRATMDQLMMKFNEMVKEIFPAGEGCFIALNGVGQYIIYASDMTKDHMDAYLSYLKRGVEEYNSTVDCEIEYEYGSAESKNSGAYRIKLLLINALHNIKPGVIQG